MPSPVRPEDVGVSDGPVVTDVAVVGAGVAGLYAAVRLPAGLDVVVVDKGTPGRSGSSPWAQGGIAAPVGADDSPARHAADTVAAGDGMCDEAAVALLTREVAGHVATLLDLGADFDRTGAEPGSARTLGGLHLAREAGHGTARSVHAADTTGAELVRVLRAAAAPRVRRLEALALRLATGGDGAVTGLWALSPRGPVEVRAGAVLLATGGCGGLFEATTNQPGSTADGLALAVGAGAAVRDLEFVQFHPTALDAGNGRRLLLTEALRGAGATLHDDEGRRFMLDVHPDAELAPRHVVTTSMVAGPGGAWLDATGLGADRLEREFPRAVGWARGHDFDLATERVPVTPAAHYMIGGVRTDRWGRSTRPGLYAVGEVAATGLHGANRMAGNSLAEALVFADRAASAIASEPPGPRPAARPLELADGVDGQVSVPACRDRLRRLMWRGAGPQRTAEGLSEAAEGLARLADQLGAASADPAQAELTLATTAARLLVAAAAARPESRGGHRRTDHPGARPDWAGVHLERTAPLP